MDLVIGTPWNRATGTTTDTEHDLDEFLGGSSPSDLELEQARQGSITLRRYDDNLLNESRCRGSALLEGCRE